MTRSISIALLSLGATLPSLAQPCNQWGREFSGRDFGNGIAYCAVPFDDGNGEALFVAGNFQTAGGVASAHIAKWDGSNWHGINGDLGNAVPGNGIFALALYDSDHGGPLPAQLFAAGSFLTIDGVPARSIARWTGSAWQAISNGISGTISALAVFDEDGPGPGLPCLFVAGGFQTINGLPIRGIARWDGSVWSDVDGGISGASVPDLIRTMVVHDDGSGPALYVGGTFQGTIGGQEIRKLARWNGAEWSDVGGSATDGATSSIEALTSFPTPKGSLLVAAGRFQRLGGVDASNIATWDGHQWRDIGDDTFGESGTIRALRVVSLSGQPILFAGGTFNIQNESGQYDRLASWNGVTWNDVGGGTSGDVHGFAEFDRGFGTELVVMGSFVLAGGRPAYDFAFWNYSEWIPRIGGLSVNNAVVQSLAVHDDGSGSALYVAGDMRFAGTQPVADIARWDGAEWSAVGPVSDAGGLSGSIAALLAVQHGPASGLYAGGTFARRGEDPRIRSNIVRWDGAAWHPLATGFGSGGFGGTASVSDIALFNDGSGPSIYAAGGFHSTGGEFSPGVGLYSAGGIAGFRSGLDGQVHCAVQFDDGTGPAYYVGGTFRSADGVPVERIAKWDGSHWVPVGGGIVAGQSVDALAVFDEDGEGPLPAVLVAGGNFFRIGTIETPHLARWDGHSWSAIGDGLSPDGRVRALAVLDDGTGSTLYVSGSFESAGAVAGTRCLAKWTGQSWLPVAPKSELCLDSWALAIFDSGGGLSSMPAPMLCNRLTNGEWEQVGLTFNNPIRALAVFDDGSGPALYIGGQFTSDSTYELDFRRLVKWDGVAMTEVGGGLFEGPFSEQSTQVRTLAVFDDGTGPALHVGGDFTLAGTVPVANFAKWDGEAWHTLPGVNAPSQTGIHALTPVQTPKGPRLFVAGAFTNVNIEFINNVARWDGQRWHSAGPDVDGYVACLGAFDDGSGPALFIGGRFTSADSEPCNRIVKWDGVTATPLGDGIGGDGNYPWSPLAFAVFDDGSGPALYVGGDFATAGGVPAPCIARWNGSEWSPVGAGFTHTSPVNHAAVGDLVVHDDGSGPALFAVGRFTASGSTPLRNIARWDGASWASVDTGLDAFANTACVWNPPGEPASLYVGGFFSYAGSTPASRVARWEPCGEPPCPADWNDDEQVNSQDFFDFLASFFAGNADYNHDGVTNSQDFFDYLAAFFAGCPQ